MSVISRVVDKSVNRVTRPSHEMSQDKKRKADLLGQLLKRVGGDDD